MLRAAILHGQTDWTPENYEPDERAALEEALQIQRESEIIQLTGWTFVQYDAQPADRVARLMTYVGMKGSIENERANQDQSGRGGGLTGGRH